MSLDMLSPQGAAMMQVGDVVAGKYELVERIGAGAVGTVFRAEQHSLRRFVALKVLSAKHTARPDAIVRFRREAKVAATLQHPNSVKVFDYGQHQNQFFLVMELLTGRTLREELDASQTGLATPRAISFLQQLSALLATAHDLPLVHRDLKPENMFVEPTGGDEHRLVVVDFGLAFLATAPSTGPDGLGRLTSDGILSGTPHYMSPEQARATAVSPKSDIYSVGCVAYELIAGRPPFEANDLARLLAKHLFEAPTPLATHATVPVALDALVARMLSKRASDRPNAGRVLEELDRISEHLYTRERARGTSGVRARPQRMLATGAQPRPVASRSLRVFVMGDVTDAFASALLDRGIVLTKNETPMIVFAPNASPSDVRALCEADKLVVVSAPAGDLGRVNQMIAAGAADLVIEPWDAIVLAKKLQRLRPGG